MRILSVLWTLALLTFTFAGTFSGTFAGGGGAMAQESFKGLDSIGKPVNGGMGFQPPVTELAHDVIFLDNLILVIIALITIFVTILLIVASYKFHEKRNKTPATFTHNSTIEVTWTVVPIIILVVIGVYSLPVLFKQQQIPVADITIKATGYQWYWGYEYVDEGLDFESVMLEKDELAEYGYGDDEYLLATDTAVVIPVDKTVVVQVTAADVIHAWTVPSFGVKQDGVPGRLAELWFKADKKGVYFGQCSELCGQAHSYMPITVKVVSQEEYDAWLVATKAEYAALQAPTDDSGEVLQLVAIAN